MANDDFLKEDPEVEGAVVPPRPRRLWKVTDTKLPVFPVFYKPCRQTSCYVTDAPPSVVAVRIAECLRRRSVAVEYDEETCKATAVTNDRCLFTISLWRASSAVLVECVRSHGPIATFHWTVRAVVLAAQSLDSGEDRRQWYQKSAVERNESSDERQVLSTKRTVREGEVVQSLERICHLLNKDRMEARRLGLESLVASTDDRVVGADAALYAALTILGAPTVEDNMALQQIHEDWIMGLVVQRRVPGEDDKKKAVQSSEMEEQHAGHFRALALTALANAFDLLARYQPSILKSILHIQSPQLRSKTVLHALTEDLQGVHRPPSVVQGTRLASVHEAVLALRCLRRLVEHSTQARSGLQNSSTLSLLDGAKQIGKATHLVLFDVASQVQQFLTEEERSC